MQYAIAVKGLYAEFIRVLKKILKFGLLGLAGAGAAAYAIDSAMVAWPGSRQLYTDVKVYQVYTDTNKWNHVEYSRGNAVTERCLYALFPHGGYRPCWYVARHTMQVTNTD